MTVNTISPSSPSIKDRNGKDVQIGDTIYFLRGSMAADGYYETTGDIVAINVSGRMVKINDGTHLHWHEFWSEPT
jgi:hypothetical protein